MEVILFAVVIVLLVLFTSKVSSLSQKVNDLQFNLQKIQGLVKTFEEDLKRVSERLPAAGTTQPHVVPPSRQDVKSRQDQFVSPTAGTAMQPASASAPAPPRPTPSPSRSREEWEAFVGGKLLNRIGAFALVLGMGFFLKYAFDNNWISETVRVLIGGFIGLACVAGAYRTHQKGFQIFSQGLVGAGQAILYLSIYAAFNFYSLIPQVPAFILMSIVTALALVQGLSYQSVAVALLGWAGGFLTPIMLSTGTSNEAGLFTYIALLDAGLLAVVLKKQNWIILEPLTLAATWLMYVTWYEQFYVSDDLGITIFFVLLFWGLFFALDVFFGRYGYGRHSLIRHAVFSLNALIVFSVLYSLIDKLHHEWMGAVTIAIGLVYFGTMLLSFRREVGEPLVGLRFALTAMALLILATAIQFFRFETVIAWSIEAAILVGAGRLWKSWQVRLAAVGLFALAAIKLLATDGSLVFVPLREFVLLLNDRSGTFIVLAICLGSAAWILRRSDLEQDATLSTWLQYAWSAIVFVLISVEIGDWFSRMQLDQHEVVRQGLDFTRLMAFAGVWSIYSVPLVVLGLRKKIVPLLYTGLSVLTLAVGLAAVRGIAFDPISLFQPLWNVRSATLLLLTGAVVFHERSITRKVDAVDWLDAVLDAMRFALVLLLLVLLTSETRDYFELQLPVLGESTKDSQASSAALRLMNLEQLSLSGVWLLYSVVLMTVGFGRKLRGLRIGAFVLFGVTIVKIFIYDLSFLETLYRIFSFMGLGVILLAVSYAYQRYKDLIFGKPESS